MNSKLTCKTCGKENVPDWNGKGQCITCSRDEVLGVNSVKYQILYADPPWAYRQKQINFQSYNKGKKYHNSVNDHYPTMTNEEIKSFPIQNLCAEDCLLYLWATGPNLDIAIEVIKAWGFEFKTVAFVWEKQRTNYGFYSLSSTEFCLVGKRGRIPKRSDNTIRQFLSEKLGKHSAKPGEIRNRIDRMYPDLKKIELFARTKADGWDSWGNEVENSVEINLRQANAEEEPTHE